MKMLIVTVASLLLWSQQYAIADTDCDPSQFKDQESSASHASQVLALSDYKNKARNDASHSSGGLGLGFEGFEVKGNSDADNHFVDQDTSDYRVSTGSSTSSANEKLYISSMYKECLLWNDANLKVREVSGSPADSEIKFFARWSPQTGDLAPKRFKFEVSGSGRSTHAPAQWFKGPNEDNFQLVGRNPESETFVTISVLNDQWNIVDSYTVNIPARLHVYKLVPKSYIISHLMAHFYAPNHDIEATGQYTVETPDTTIDGYNFRWENPQGHIDHYKYDGDHVSADKQTLNFHGKLFQSGGRGAAVDLMADIRVTQLIRTDVTDDPYNH